MKKFMALLTASVLALSLCSCGGDKNIRGDVSGNNGGNVDAPETDAEFSLGEVNEQTYENKFIGLGCTLDSDWEFYNDEQIREINNAVTDMAGDEFTEKMKEADIVYDMYAMASNGNNINVNLEKVNSIQLAVLDVADALESQIPALKEALGNIGYENINSELTTVKIGDKEYDAISTTADISGISVYQVTFTKKCSGYLANVSIATFSEDMTDDIIGKFYNVE